VDGYIWIRGRQVRKSIIIGNKLTAPQEEQVLLEPLKAVPHLGQLLLCMLAVCWGEGCGLVLFKTKVNQYKPLVIYRYGYGVFQGAAKKRSVERKYKYV
jgi:hypothetical protein